MDTHWLAGFFDGEGSVGLYRNRHHPQVMLTVCIAQKDRTILDLIAAAYPEGKVRKATQPTGGLGKKCHMHFFRLYGSKAKRFLEDISPFVKVKKSQVDMAIEFIGLLLPPSWKREKGSITLTQDIQKKRESLMFSMKEAKQVTNY